MSAIAGNQFDVRYRAINLQAETLKENNITYPEWFQNATQLRKDYGKLVEEVQDIWAQVEPQMSLLDGKINDVENRAFYQRLSLAVTVVTALVPLIVSFFSK